MRWRRQSVLTVSAVGAAAFLVGAVVPPVVDFTRRPAVVSSHGVHARGDIAFCARAAVCPAIGLELRPSLPIHAGGLVRTQVDPAAVSVRVIVDGARDYARTTRVAPGVWEWRAPRERRQFRELLLDVDFEDGRGGALFNVVPHRHRR